MRHIALQSIITLLCSSHLPHYFINKNVISDPCLSNFSLPPTHCLSFYRIWILTIAHILWLLSLLHMAHDWISRHHHRSCSSSSLTIIWQKLGDLHCFSNLPHNDPLSWCCNVKWTSNTTDTGNLLIVKFTVDKRKSLKAISRKQFLTLQCIWVQWHRQNFAYSIFWFVGYNMWL